MSEITKASSIAEMLTNLHRSRDELEMGYQALPPAPRDSGFLALIVCRRAPGSHEALNSVRLTPEEGIPGDEWNRRLPQKPEAQLTVIRRDVAELIANGQPLTTSGDNLVVELDISSENLPIGTRLRIGAAIVEVTSKPHNGCNKFQARFGADALRFVQAPQTRPKNLRGIYWRVIEAGEVKVGSPIQVIARL